MLIDDFRREQTHVVSRILNRKATPAKFRTPEAIAEMNAQVGELIEMIDKSQRFVLSPQVVEAAHDLSRSRAAITHSRDYIFSPAKTTWLEWSGGGVGSPESHRHAVLLNGWGNETTAHFVGSGYYVRDANRMAGWFDCTPIKYDLPGSGAIISHTIDSDFRKSKRFSDPRLEALWENDRLLDFERMGRFVAAAMALINAPRITQVIEHDLSRLNAARSKKDRRPIITYKDVLIRPDSGWTSKSEMRGLTGEKRRHHVRGHLRLKRGRVELVTAHFRGNREKGYVLHRHVVRMTDEEAGAWKGAPLPASMIMEPGTRLMGDE